MRGIKSLILVSLLGLFLVLPGIVFGQEIKVNHIAGKVEKVKEKLTLLFKFNKSAKADYYQYLAQKRLAELSYVVENDQINLVEETASRYSTYIGILTNYVVANGLTSKKSDLSAMFDKHAELIKLLQKKFKYDSGWWLAIQHDINTISLLKDKLNNL